MFQKILASFLMVYVLSSQALNLELTQGINAAIPLGIAAFGSDDLGHELSKIIAHDLHLSGQFKIIESPEGTRMNQWQVLGADGVLTGSVTLGASNQYKVHFELADAQAHGRMILAKNYQITPTQLRALAHHISDEVYQKLTGIKGVFSTRIAYILVQRDARAARYFLEVSDFDGANPKQLLRSSEPIMSPTWSPSGREIAYVSFEKKRAEIFTVSIETGERRLLTSFPGINGAPAWSPDGRQMAVVLSKSGAPKIYSLDLASKTMKQLSFGPSIDTEPRFSPDGRSILFTSGRGGTPQIYQLNLADGQIKRISFEGNYNAKASFSPNQELIALLHRKDHAFNIGVQSLSSGKLTQLTNSDMNESPSISPNGRLVIYATHYFGKGILAMVSIDGKINLRLPAREGDVQEPAWSPYFN